MRTANLGRVEELAASYDIAMTNNSALLQGLPVPLSELTFSVRKDVDITAFDTELGQAIQPAVQFAAAIGDKTNPACMTNPDRSDIYGLPVWQVSGAIVRSNMTPKQIFTGEVGKLCLQLIDPGDLSATTRRGLFAKATELRPILESALAITVSGQLGDIAVGCAIGLQVGLDTQLLNAGKPRSYVAGKVTPLPKMAAANAQASLARWLAAAREQRAAAHPLSGGTIESARSKH